MSDPQSARKAKLTGPKADPSPKRKKRLRAKSLFASLWQNGSLFHVSSRYPRKRHVAKVDRLAAILRSGIIAPASCQDGSVCSDLNLLMTGTDIPYESLVFLHCYGPQSYLYTFMEPGRFIVFVDPAFPVMTPELMGEHWALLCQDEVYVRDRVPPERLIGVIVHSADADAVKAELLGDIQRLGIPFFDDEGKLHWQPE